MPVAVTDRAVVAPLRQTVCGVVDGWLDIVGAVQVVIVSLIEGLY